MKIRKFKNCIAVAILCGGIGKAYGYQDDFVTIDDDTVQCTVDGDSRTYVFTNTAATATVTMRKATELTETLVVGGGGGGGWTLGGGGGGGGVRHATGLSLTNLFATTISVTVGAGGKCPASDGRYTDKSGPWYAGDSGGDSVVVAADTTFTGHGGGGGGGWDSSCKPGRTGGSSGGACFSQTASAVTKDADELGNPGGNSVGNVAGGGGGATEPGDAGKTSGSNPGDGGEGYACSITGTSVVYGSGGGGGGQGVRGVGGTNAGTGGTSNSARGGFGVNGTGGGGGGGGWGGGSNGVAGGDGGHGIVVLVLAKVTTTDRSFTVDPIPDQMFFGEALCPKPTVTDAEDATIAMVENEDYSLSWTNNTGFGTGTVTVQGLGSYSKVVRKVDFTIEDGLVDTGAAYTMQRVGSRIVYVFSTVTNGACVKMKTGATLAEALVVGGGGAGGSTIGGGGGGGGVRYETPGTAMLSGDHFYVTVGAGGNPTVYLAAPYSQRWSPGGNGYNTCFAADGLGLHYVGHGGGGGGAWDSSVSKAGFTGGSAGGSCQSNTTKTQPTKDEDEMGNAGGAAAGNSPGGGGGASAAGGSGSGSVAGDGGEGYACSITGTSQVYGSGGGGGAGNACKKCGAGGTNAGAGGAYNSGKVGGDGTAGYGGGGGGGSYTPDMRGGYGGSGTVVLSFTLGTAASNTFTVGSIGTQILTGSALVPEPAVTNASGTELVKGTHYTVTYRDNDKVGTGYALVEGLAPYDNYRQLVPFQILSEDAKDAKWIYSGTTLTEILPCESAETPWVFTLTEAGALSCSSVGTGNTVDLGDDALPANSPDIKTIASSTFYNRKPLVSVTLPSTVTSVPSSSFSYSTALMTIRWKGWYDIVTPNVAIGNWSEKKCRFIVPGDNLQWLSFIASYVEPWDDLTESVQAEYTSRYGSEERLIPAGLTKTSVPGNRTWVVKTDDVIASNVIIVEQPDAVYGQITLNPEPGDDGTYTIDTPVTVTFVPATDVTFLGWGDAVPVEERKNLSVVIVANGAKAMSASYVANFLVYDKEKGTLTDSVEIINASGNADAITVTGATKLNDGCMDISKPIYGGGKIVSITGFTGSQSKYVNWLRRVILPDTLETIADQCFDCCSSITNVTPLLPRSLKTIGYSAFAKTSIRGNVELGFGTESDGSPRMVTLHETNVGYKGNRLADSTGVGPCIRIGPGVTKLSGAMFVNMGANTVTNIYLAASVTNVTAGTFSAYTKCDVTFAGDLPAMVNNSFLAPSAYAYRLFVPSKNVSGWTTLLRDEAKVTPWRFLSQTVKNKYWSRWPKAKGEARPYGLTTSAACAGDHAVPANQWIMCDLTDGSLMRIR